MTVQQAEQIVEQYSGWELAQLLRLKCEQCPEQGMRSQLTTTLDTLINIGGPWLIVGNGPRAEQVNQ